MFKSILSIATFIPFCLVTVACFDTDTGEDVQSVESALTGTATQAGPQDDLTTDEKSSPCEEGCNGVCHCIRECCVDAAGDEYATCYGNATTREEWDECADESNNAIDVCDQAYDECLNQQ